jgi:hypothetical protein
MVLYWNININRRITTIEYDVTAKQLGNQIKFTVEVPGDIKEALEAAKKEANRVFDYHMGDEVPTVTVKEA